MHSVFCVCNVLKVSFKSDYSVVPFSISVALLIFSLRDLSTDVPGVLKASNYCVPSVSLFMFVSISLQWSLYHDTISFFIFLYILCFKVYLVSYEYCDSSRFCLHEISFYIPSLLIFKCPLSSSGPFEHILGFCFF